MAGLDEAGERRGIPELRSAIARVAASLPEMWRTVPKWWQDSRQALKDSGRTSAHVTRLPIAMQQHGIPRPVVGIARRNDRPVRFGRNERANHRRAKPRLVTDPCWPDLAARIARIDRAGIPMRRLLHSVADAKPLSDG